jgi:hypothetical protein
MLPRPLNVKRVGEQIVVDWRAGLGLIKQKTVAVKAVPLKGDSVTNAQAAPAHQQCHRAQACPQILNRDEASSRVSVDVRCAEDSLKFIGREVVGRDLNDFDFSKAQGRVLDQVPAAHAGPEKPDHTALFLLLGERFIAPGVAEIEQNIEIDLIDVLESLHLGPGEKLLAEDGLKFVEGGFSDVAANRVGEIRIDSRLDRDARPFGRLWQRFSRSCGSVGRACARRRGWLGVLRRRWCQSFAELSAEFFGLFPAVGAGALADELAIQGSPDPLRAVAAAPGLVIGVFAVGMVAGVDGEHLDPKLQRDSARIAEFGQKIEAEISATVQ